MRSRTWWGGPMDRPETYTVMTVDTDLSVARITLETELEFRPGQFAMVWVPDVDEVPLSIVGGSPLEFVVQEVGEATSEFISVDEGELLGVRGPYGSGFDIVEGDVLLVGGGVGAAPLIPLAREVERFDAVIGAGTKDLLVGEEELDADVATEDGSKGHRGLVTEPLETYNLDRYEMVYCCGPEAMMREVARVCGPHVDVQFSLERYVKCGIGICGSCCIDPGGERVCVEGPVFYAEELEGTEFGRYRRDASGTRRKI